MLQNSHPQVDERALIGLIGEVEERVVEPAKALFVLAAGLRRHFVADVVWLGDIADFRTTAGLRGPVVTGLDGDAARDALLKPLCTASGADPALSGLRRRFTAAPQRVMVGRAADLAADAGAESRYRARLRRVAGLEESLYSTVIVGDSARVSVLCLWRDAGRAAFSDAERDTLGLFQRATVDLHRRLVRVGNLALTDALGDLRPSWRDTLQALLQGHSEKVIASDRGLSPHTVHEYVRALYAHFGVGSRSELLARFIEPQPATYTPSSGGYRASL